MLTAETLAVQNRTYVASADPIAAGEFDLSDYSFQGSHFGCLLKGYSPSPSVKESMFAVGDGLQMGRIDTSLLSTTVMDDQPLGDRTVDSFIGDPVSPPKVGSLPVTEFGYETLPDETGWLETPVFFNPCLGKPPMVAEKITKGLACNPAASGMAPRSDGRGISAPTETKTVAHNVESYHSGRCF